MRSPPVKRLDLDALRQRHLLEVATIETPRGVQPESRAAVESYPAVTAIGYIPELPAYLHGPEQIWDEDTTGTYRPPGVSSIFLTANREPPRNAATENGFSELLQSKDFRGAFRIDNIELRRQEDGAPTSARCRVFYRGGYTPVPMIVGRIYLGGAHALAEEAVASNGALVWRIRLLYKIGKVLDKTMVRWVNRGWLAPWAWTEIQLAFSAKANSVRLVGANIPSHRLGIGETLFDGIDMLRHTPDDYRSFNRSGACSIPRGAFATAAVPLVRIGAA